MSEKQPGQNWDMILGDDPKKIEQVEQELHSLQEGEIVERRRDFELEKTDDERQIISEMLHSVKEVVIKYGGNPKDISENDVIVVRPEDFASADGSENTMAYYNSYYNKIVIKRSNSNLIFGNYISHELLHAHGYRSHSSHKGEAMLHRSGITVFENNRDGSKDRVIYFGDLEEAIISRVNLEQRSIFTKGEVFKQEQGDVEYIKNWFIEAYEKLGIKTNEKNLELWKKVTYTFRNSEHIRFIIDSDISHLDNEKDEIQYKFGWIASTTGKRGIDMLDVPMVASYGAEYLGLQLQLDEVIGELSEKSGKSKEEIFDMFAHANFSGELLDLARFVESNMGKGTFRYLGENFGKQK